VFFNTSDMEIRLGFGLSLVIVFSESYFSLVVGARMYRLEIP